MELKDFPLAKVQAMSWLLLAALTVAGGLSFTWKFAEGVLVGGVIANVSFL